MVPNKVCSSRTVTMHQVAIAKQIVQYRTITIQEAMTTSLGMVIHLTNLYIFSKFILPAYNVDTHRRKRIATR